MKGFLCFDTKYGSTEQICRWIASEIKCAQVIIQNVNLINNSNYGNYDNYDFYIIGTPIFIGKPMKSVVDFIQLNEHKFIGKPVFLFITSWAQSTKYKEECGKFINLMKFYLAPCEAILIESLPGKLLMDKITQRDRKTMERLLRRIDNMSSEFDSKKIIFNDQRSKKLSMEFGRKINEKLKYQSSLL